MWEIFTRCNMMAKAALLDPTLNPSSVRRWLGWPSCCRRRTVVNWTPAARIWRVSRPRHSPELRLPTQVPRSAKFEALGGREPVLNTHFTCFLLGAAAVAWRLLPPLIHCNQMRKWRHMTYDHANHACLQREGLFIDILNHKANSFGTLQNLI